MYTYLYLYTYISICVFYIHTYIRGFPGDTVVKNLPTNVGDTGHMHLIPGSGRSSGGINGNHSSILAERIPCTKEPGRLQFTGSQRVGHDFTAEHACIHKSK